MIYLLLAIIFSTAIFVVMRLFSRFEIDNHQGLAWNYATATGIGYLMSALNGPVTSPVGEAWFPLSLLTGFWFILTYVLMTVSSQRSGVTVTSLSSKLSVVIPTLFGVLILKESLGVLPAIGIVLALVALFLVVGGKKEEKALGHHKPSVWIALLPVFIFFGTGIGDVLMKITEKANTASDLTPMIAFIYGISFLFSLLMVGFDFAKKQSKWQWKNMVGGMILGGVNFFSTYFVYQAMRVFDNVVLFPIYNIGVVCLTALCGWLLFKEKLTWKNYLGLGIAVVAVILIAFKP